MVAEVGVVEGVGEVEGVEAEVEVMVMKMVVAKAKLQLNSQQLMEVVSMINLREPLVVVMVKLGLLDSPSAFIAKNQGSDQYNHWPNRCELLGSVISGYHQEQAKTGHTDNMGNTSEHS